MDIEEMLKNICGPDSSVGIATGYGLDGQGIESRWGPDIPHLSRPALGVHPASCTMVTGSFPGVKGGRGLTLIPHPLLVFWSRNCRAIPLFPLWAVRPVQSLSACKRVHFFTEEYLSITQYVLEHGGWLVPYSSLCWTCLFTVLYTRQ